MFCKCGGIFDDVTLNLTGTRDSFGISKSFYDPKTRQYIDTYPKWERAGYRDPLKFDYKKNPEIKDKIKFNMKRKDTQNKAPAVEVAERI